MEISFTLQDFVFSSVAKGQKIMYIHPFVFCTYVVIRVFGYIILYMFVCENKTFLDSVIDCKN